jgi:hypothetical protein
MALKIDQTLRHPQSQLGLHCRESDPHSRSPSRVAWTLTVEDVSTTSHVASEVKKLEKESVTGQNGPRGVSRVTCNPEAQVQ